MIIRLTIQNTDGAIRAEISKRDDLGHRIKGGSEVFVVPTKEEAKKRARSVARSLGLKTYRVVDRT